MSVVDRGLLCWSRVWGGLHVNFVCDSFFSHDTFLPCDKRALNVSKRKLSIITIAFNQTLIMTHIRKDCLCILFYPQEQEDFSHNLAFRNIRNETFPSVKYV